MEEDCVIHNWSHTGRKNRFEILLCKMLIRQQRTGGFLLSRKYIGHFMNILYDIFY